MSRLVHLPLFSNDSRRLDGYTHEEYDRPQTRGECEDVPRPCPWVSCRHHLLIDVTMRGDLVKPRKFDETDPESVAFTLMTMETCALDVAEHENTAEVVGRHLNVTRQRIEAIEHVAHNRARAKRSAGEARADWKQLLTRR